MIKELAAICPNVDPQLINEHCTRMSESYFTVFTKDSICGHLKALSRLTKANPIEFLWETLDNGMISCTLCAFDNPFVFSLITGILSSTGFDIHAGEVFTWSRSRTIARHVEVERRKKAFLTTTAEPLWRRRIIDFFLGEIKSDTESQLWAVQVKDRLSTIFRLMERGDHATARQMVNHMVAFNLSSHESRVEPILYPLEIKTEQVQTGQTRFVVLSQDAPFFLYSLSNALSLQGLSIEQVDIQTMDSRIQDTIDITDGSGKCLTDETIINKITLSVLLTKQFTYFLSSSPDPYNALIRFEQIVKDIVAFPHKQRWVQLLLDPLILKDLAVLLGTSDYLWEDFIRLQYESLVPLLDQRVKQHHFSQPSETIEIRLDQACAACDSYESLQEQINVFKDREIYLIDLDHILHDDFTFEVLAQRLTTLAQVVIRKAFVFVYEQLCNQYGEPETVGGITADYALLGLGKLGGAALGYASDLELLTVYSDNGHTSGTHSISNAEFFDLLVKKSTRLIQAKRSGIFAIDLRLRPYGKDGPLACSLESFCKYYSKEGAAHSYERLALVRLRAIGGDGSFGAQIERIRDQYIYTTQCIHPQDIRTLRKKQYHQKADENKVNAKFSQGGLVDLEYDVQLLQVMYGGEFPQLRTPNLATALSALVSVGVLQQEEGMRLIEAHTFLCVLINGLRMLRGSAEDLVIPDADSMEFYHLARRMRYEGKKGLSAVQQLRIDLETHTARIRTFAEQHFGRESLPSPQSGNIADIILSQSIPEELSFHILKKYGFLNTQRARTNIRRLIATPEARYIFSRLAVLAMDILNHKADPDRAFNNWERLVSQIENPALHFQELLSQPRRLDILLSIFSSSQWLADMLILNADFFDWVTTPSILHTRRTQQIIEKELRTISCQNSTPQSWHDALRQFRKREILRIGTRDLCLNIALETITEELADCASGIIQVTLHRVWQHFFSTTSIPQSHHQFLQDSLCILALGKLGGRELNYSSDIDIIGIYALSSDDEKTKLYDNHTAPQIFNRILEQLCYDLSHHTTQGYVYRVDTRLRPYGRAGSLTLSFEKWIDYYRNHASLWEIQALIKLRPVVGNASVGDMVMREVISFLTQTTQPEMIIRSTEQMRIRSIKQRHRHIQRGVDIKNGRGGIRDIEFLVQGLQRIHAPTFPAVIHGNTLKSLKLLGTYALLPDHVIHTLYEHYLFLRRIEHFLQLLEDCQVHEVPVDTEARAVLARHILNVECRVDDFDEKLNKVLTEVFAVYERYLLDFDHVKQSE